MTQITAREIGILEAISRGMRNREIADELGIGIETVSAHVRNARRKLGAVNRTQAVMKAQALGYCLQRSEHRPVRCPFCERGFHVEIQEAAA